MFSNKKMFVRVLALCLTLALLAAGAGCKSDSGGKDVEKKNVTEKNESLGADGLPNIDLGGYVFKVADYDRERWDYKPGASAFGDMVIQRNKYVESRFNCKIELIQVDPGSFFTQVQPKIMAGDKFADVIMPTMWGFGKFVSADILADISTVPHLKLDQPYWVQAVTELTTVNGKIHGVANEICNHHNLQWGIYFNKRIINELGLENPYQLVREKKWTFEKLREMAKLAVKDLNGDNIMDQNDRYGFAGSEGDLVNAMFTSAGFKMLDTDENGKVQYVMNNPKAIDFINLMKQIIRTDGLFYPKKPEQDWMAHYEAFKAGRVLFFSYLSGMEELRDMEDDWGFVPMPMGPGATDYTGWVDHNVAVMGIPMSNNDLDKTGLILEALAWKSQEERHVRLDHYDSTFFRDDDSTEMQAMLFGRGIYDLAYLAWQPSPAIARGTVHLLARNAYADPQAEPASSFAQVEEAVRKAVDDFFNKKK